jgi:hypothetical protein
MVATGGCGKLVKNNDGDACTEGSDCDSERCNLAGFCDGSRCPCTAGDLFDCHDQPMESKDCNDGWLCAPQSTFGWCRQACSDSSPCPQFFTCADGVCELHTANLPEPTITFTAPADVPVGETFTLSSETTSPNGPIVLVRWMLGDHTEQEGASITHAYSELGDYRVTVSAKDRFERFGHAEARIVACRPAGSSCVNPTYKDYCCGTTGCRPGENGMNPSCR